MSFAIDAGLIFYPGDVRKKGTNADKIRSMSDDELAAFLSSIDLHKDHYGDPIISFRFFNKNIEIGGSDEEIKEWLERELE